MDTSLPSYNGIGNIMVMIGPCVCQLSTLQCLQWVINEPVVSNLVGNQNIVSPELKLLDFDIDSIVMHCLNMSTVVSLFKLKMLNQMLENCN